jgi:DNA-binding IscR family transcriptional regulator
MKLQTGTRLGLYAVLELARDPAQTLSSADSPSASACRLIILPVLRTLSRGCAAERGASGGYRFTGNAAASR